MAMEEADGWERAHCGRTHIGVPIVISPDAVGSLLARLGRRWVRKECVVEVLVD